MRTLEETPDIEVLDRDRWVYCHLEQLDEGDIYRLRTPDGELQESPCGRTSHIITEQPKIISTPLD